VSVPGVLGRTRQSGRRQVLEEEAEKVVQIQGELPETATVKQEGKDLEHFVYQTAVSGLNLLVDSFSLGKSALPAKEFSRYRFYRRSWV